MHEGHRSRLVSKIKNGGIVYEHELLEILLFNSCPRKDLNATAHALLDGFGTLGGVLDADSANLAKIKGVGVNMAEYVSVLGKAVRQASGGENTFARVANVKEFQDYLFTRPAPETDCVELYCLDKDGGVRRVCVFRAKKGLRADPTESEILKLLSAHRPYGLFVSSWRVGGSAVPDVLNDRLCDRIDKVARLCGATLYDYCLAGGNGGFYSYKMNDRSVFAENNLG